MSLCRFIAIKSRFNLVAILFILAFSCSGLWAAGSAIYKKEVKAEFSQVHKKVYAALEKKRFYIIFEAHISDNLARFKQKWGAQYNKNKLDTIRSLLVCNIYYVNQVSNLDPDLLSLCPLRVVLVEKKPFTRILFIKPSYQATASPALAIIKEVENEIIQAIESAVN